MPAVLNAAGGKTVELHTHCTTGLGTLCCLEAIKAGMTHINTAIPPLADGSSNPSLFNVAMNARALGYKTMINEKPLRDVADHFTACAKQDNLPIGKTPEYDYAQYVHQIPGGMISNLRHQLRRVGMENKLDQTLEEAAQVRAEFGYPIMVTPLSQFVGSQAAINVIVGERYKQVTDQTIEYAMGIWGKEGAEFMDPNVKEKILNRPRAKEIAGTAAPDRFARRPAPQVRRHGSERRRCAAALFLQQRRRRAHARRRPGAHLYELAQSDPQSWSTSSQQEKRSAQRLHPDARDFSLRMERRREV